jgi:hypothetical protein
MDKETCIQNRTNRVINTRRKNNPIARQLSNPLWKMRIVKSKVLYNRKYKHKKGMSNENK